MQNIIQFGTPHKDAHFVEGIAALIFNPKTQEFAFLKTPFLEYVPITGGRDGDESLEDTVRREILEEGGFDDIKYICKIGDYFNSNYFHTGKNKWISSKGHPHLVIVDPNSVSQTNHEIHEIGTEIIWCSGEYAIEQLLKNEDQVRMEPFIYTIKEAINLVKENQGYKNFN